MTGLLNERQASRYLDISPTHLRRLRQRGLISVEQVTLRNRALYSRAALDDYLYDCLAQRPQRTYRFGNESVTVIYDEEP